MSQLLSYEDLASKGVSLSNCQLRRLERAGKFPKRVRVSDLRHAWVESEIDEYISRRIAARSKEAA